MSAIYGQVSNLRSLLLACIVALLVAPASALGDDPDAVDFYAGNPSCADIDQNYGETWLELKVEPVSDGVYSNAHLSVTVDVKPGSVFDFTANPGVDAVIVKGGPDGNAYVYSPDATSGTNLHAPDNGNGSYYGLSHISFCYDLTGSIGGQKWHDLDADGVRDAGELGVAGYKFWLDKNANGIKDVGDPEATTDAQGFYAFTDLPNGTYTVYEMPDASQLPANQGFICSSPTPCSYTVTINTANAQTRSYSGKDFGNYKNAKVRIDKVTTGLGADPEHDFNFTTSPSTAPPAGLGANFPLDSTDPVHEVTVKPNTAGLYQVTEGTDGQYTLTGIACNDSDSTDAGRTATINVSSGETVTCTFTNTRDTGTVKVKKVVVGDDQGLFDLSIAGEVVSGEDGVNDSGFFSETVPTGATSVDEDGHAPTLLSDYESSLSCVDDNGTPNDSGDDVTFDDDESFDVEKGHTYACTYTNERKKGVVKVKKVVVGDDQGLFDLSIAGEVVSGEDGVNDSGFFSENLDTGPTTVDEDGHGDTSLADYESSLSCVDDNGTPNDDTDDVTFEDDESFDVEFGHTYWCTYTNERRTGTVEVVKDVQGPAPASDLFDLLIDGSVAGTGDDVGDGGTTGEVELPSNVTYDVGEAAAGTTDLGDYVKSVECVDHAGEGEGTVIASNPDGPATSFQLEEGADVVCTIVNARPDLDIEKYQRVQGSGGDYTQDMVIVQPGQVIEYKIVLTNTGQVTLTEVDIADLFESDQPDEQLEGCESGGSLEPGQSIEVLCQRTVVFADGAACENTATGSGDSNGVPADPDTSSVTCEVTLPPLAIDIEKTGPARVNAGEVIEYGLDITNPGQTAYAADKVIVTDPRCDAPPVLVSKNGDPTEGQFDPGDRWSYTCSVLTQSGMGSVTNTAFVEGTDPFGRKANDEDTVVTLIDEIAVLPVLPGSARASGPASCVNKTFKVKLRGERIATATVFIDGKRYKRLSTSKLKSRFTVKINPAKFSRQMHRVRINVRFADNTAPTSRTLNLSFKRCARQAVKPVFTG